MLPPLPDDADVVVTVDDELFDVTLELFKEAAWDDAYELTARDPGVSLACLEGLGPLEGGESLRLWWGDQGPWQATLASGEMGTVIRERRRGK